MAHDATQAAESWLDKIKLKLESFARDLDLSWAKATEFGIAAFIGFIFGFAVKKYARHVIVYLLFFGIGLLLLQHLQVITIDFEKLKSLIGITPTENLEGTLSEYFEWAKSHILTVIIGGIGFGVGYKVG